MKSPIQRQMELFSAALEHTAGQERDLFIQTACAGDEALLECVRMLLVGHSQAETFLAQPADLPGATGKHPFPVAEKPGDKIGRYKLLQQIGEGGCGTVYMAEQEEPVRRRVALKVIRLGMDTKSVVARFEAERQALALMDHPNIAKVFDGGATQSGRPYFVMELVRGIKITEYCDQAQLSTKDRLKLFIQVCQAVQHAHQKGIIHRDIKPSNILVTVNDGVAVPKIIDFGIAKATDQRLTEKTYFTEFRAFIGTPAYTSPEQAEMSSLDIDTRSDIYSLGVLLYEMLTGRTPFPAERLLQSGLDEMRRIIREEEPPRPSARLTTLPVADASELSRKRQLKIPALVSAVEGDIDWIVMKALEKDRTRRYATTLDFAADLQRHLNSEAVLARPPSLGYRFQRAVRRNKGPFAAAAAVFLALLIGLGLTGWQAVRANRAEHAARGDRDRAFLAESNATEKAAAATNALQAANERMVSLNVAEGWRRVEEGDHFGALLPFAEALALEQDKPDRAEIHQMRLASVLQQCPKLANVWSVGMSLLGAAFNSDGSKLLTIVSNSAVHHAVQCWDTSSGRPITPLIPCDPDYSIWSRDGTRFLTTLGRRDIRVWDASNGQRVSAPIVTKESVWSCSLNRDGTKLLIHWRENESLRIDKPYVALLETASGNAIWEHAVDMDEPMFSPGDRYIVAKGTLFDAATGLEKNSSTNGFQVGFLSQSSTIRVVATPSSTYIVNQPHAWILGGDDLSQFISALPPQAEENEIGLDWTRQWMSPDGFWMVTKDSMSHRRGIRLWNLKKGVEVTPSAMNQSDVDLLYFSDNSQWMAMIDSKSYARVWDVNSGVPATPQMKHEGKILAVAFDRGNTRLMTAAADGSISSWDLRAAGIPRFTFPLQKEMDTIQQDDLDVQLAYDKGGTIIAATVTEAGGIWDISAGTLVRPIIDLPRSSPCNLRLSPDGRRIFYSDSHQNGNTKLQEVSTGIILSKPDLGATEYRMHVSQDGEMVLRYGDATNRAHLSVFSSVTGKLLADLRAEGEVRQAAFSPDGKMIFGLLTDRHLFWSLDSRQTVTYLTNKEMSGDVEYPLLLPSPEGAWLAWFARDSITVFDPVSGERSTSADGFFYRGHFYPSPDLRKYLVSEGSDVWLCDTASRRSITPRMSSRGLINAAGFSSDGKKLVTASADRTTRIWDSTTGEQIVPSFWHPFAPVRALINPNGRGVVTYDLDCIRYWELPKVSHPASDWLRLAGFFAGGRSSPGGGLSATMGASFSPHSFRDQWQALRAKHPDVFTVSADEEDAWYRHEAWRCESRQDWSNAVVHLSALLETHPDSGDFLPRRAAAHVGLAKSLTNEVATVTDSTSSAVALRPNNPNELIAMRTAATNHWESALLDYDRTLAWVNRFPAIAKESRKPFLEQRRVVYLNLGRKSEAEADERELNASKQ